MDSTENEVFRAAIRGDREAFLCAERHGDRVLATARQSASAQCMLALADVLIRVPPGSGRLEADMPVELLRF